MVNDDKQGFWNKFFYGPERVVVENREGSVGSAGGDSPLSGVVPPIRSTYASISPETALTIGAVYRSISIITASISQMELGTFRDGVEIKSSPLVRQPNIDDSVTGFVEETVFSLAAYGNAFWRLYGDPISNVVVLDPQSVTVGTDPKTGEKAYWVGPTQVPARSIRHLRLMRRPGHKEGYGPIQSGTAELRSALDLRDFASNWYNGSGVPTGMLTTDMNLNATDAAAYAEAWKAFLASHGGTAVLSQGMRYEPLHIKPAEAQFLEVQQASTVNIARLFGVPAMHVLAEVTGTSNTYLNLEQANIVFLQTTLSRYMNEIEEALSSLLPRGQRVQFKEDGLLRMDSVTKWSVIQTQVDAGYTSGNELRKAEGKSPLPTPVKAPVGKEANKDEVSEQNGND